MISCRLRMARNWLSHFFEQHDFTVYPLDEPFPDLGLGANGDTLRDHFNLPYRKTRCALT